MKVNKLDRSRRGAIEGQGLAPRLLASPPHRDFPPRGPFSRGTGWTADLALDPAFRTPRWRNHD
jgi:hypothetical protein